MTDEQWIESWWVVGKILKMENQGFHGSIYTGEGSVNLREFQARQENPTNLDLCEDELFDEIFPRNPKESELEKEKGSIIRLK